MLNGKGLFIYHNDRLCLGEWKDNKLHGEGTYKWGDGRMFIGQYLNDMKNGEGMYLWADGRAYNGQWENGRQHGQGFYIILDKSKHNSIKIKKGLWENGQRQYWIDNMTNGEFKQQHYLYQQIQERKMTIENDIEAIENAMKQLVIQQLGDHELVYQFHNS